MRWLPNLITCARIALTPLVAYAIARRECPEALWLVAVAALTDGFDGLLARRFGWATRSGAYLDPIADKLLLTAMYLALVAGDLAPLWLGALVVGRDLAILLMAAVAVLFTTVRDFPPSLWGKISTAIQIAGALILLAGCAAWPRSQMTQQVAVVAVATGTAWSGIHYIWRGVCTWKDVRRMRV